eukprot:COSAG02_NODE_1546_length_11977_cov_3.458586_6_plen_130_part_00
MDHQALVDKVLKRLKASSQIVCASARDKHRLGRRVAVDDECCFAGDKMERLGFELTADGQKAAVSGSPEYLVWSMVPSAGTTKEELTVRARRARGDARGEGCHACMCTVLAGRSGRGHSQERSGPNDET